MGLRTLVVPFETAEEEIRKVIPMSLNFFSEVDSPSRSIPETVKKITRETLPRVLEELALEERVACTYGIDSSGEFVKYNGEYQIVFLIREEGEIQTIKYAVRNGIASLTREECAFDWNKYKTLSCWEKLDYLQFRVDQLGWEMLKI